VAIQELDIRIHRLSGKHNSNADALFCFPICHPPGEEEQCGVVAAMESCEAGNELAALQWRDEQLTQIITFLETGVLPLDEKNYCTFPITIHHQ